YLDSLHLVEWGEKQDFDYDLLALANVRYLVSDRYDAGIAARSESVSEKRQALPGFLKPGPVFTYRLKDTFPRAFLAGSARFFPNDTSLLAALSSASLEELSGTVFFSAEDAAQRPGGPVRVKSAPAGAAEFLEYKPDRLKIRVVASRPGFLVISNNFHPGWNAAVDGRPAALLRAYHAFQAVPIDSAGTHEVLMEFRDSALWPLHLFIVLGFLVSNSGVLLRSVRVGHS
ncbi:MAG TPA: hypothetical protein PKK31_11120, partial [Elusimicrobiales bacterium]|nr:hypothetical protein [Elusimicrobiales bacterium]